MLIIADKNHAYQVTDHKADTARMIAKIADSVMGNPWRKPTDTCMSEIDGSFIVDIEKIAESQSSAHKLYELAKISKKRYSEMGFAWVEKYIMKEGANAWIAYCGHFKIVQERRKWPKR